MADFQAHDLLELADREAFVRSRVLPQWAAASLRRAPFLVVRRGTEEEKIPVGIRGTVRGERWADRAAPEEIAHRYTPGSLLKKVLEAPEAYGETGRCLARLADIPGLPADSGPGGSAGFWIASGICMMTPESDLDFVIRTGGPMPAEKTLRCWHSRMMKESFPIDAVVMTEQGIFSLTEAVRSPGCFLLKAADRCSLVDITGNEVEIKYEDSISFYRTGEPASGHVKADGRERRRGPVF